jgi:hypothetical protein
MHSPTVFLPVVPTFPPDCYTTVTDGVEYRMYQEREEGQSVTEEEWGGPLVIQSQKNPFICPVKCWMEYDRRFRDRYKSRYTPNRAFLRLDSSGCDVTETPHPSGCYFEGNWSGKWWREGRLAVFSLFLSLL